MHIDGLRWNCVKDDMKSFGLSHEDAQDKDDWRMTIRGNQLIQVYLQNDH